MRCRCRIVVVTINSLYSVGYLCLELGLSKAVNARGRKVSLPRRSGPSFAARALRCPIGSRHAPWLTLPGVCLPRNLFASAAAAPDVVCVVGVARVEG